MEMEISTVLPVIISSLFLIWMGTLYLRNKSIVLSSKTLWALILIMVLFMYISQIIVAYQRHLDFEKEWIEDVGTRYGTPPTFNWYPILIPMLMIIPMLLIFMYIFKNSVMIYNIIDEDLSKNLSATLEELKWEYDRDFTYIHVREPKIKIKVGMMNPMRSCNIFFREFNDQLVVKQFKETLRTNISGNEVKPFLPLGLLFVFMGILFPIMIIIMYATI